MFSNILSFLKYQLKWCDAIYWVNEMNIQLAIRLNDVRVNGKNNNLIIKCN